jgi:hypothetical protein
MRQILRAMRNNGLLVDKSLEYNLRKLLEKKLTSVAGGVSAITKILSAPVYVFLKVILTPSRVASDAEENYMGFKTLNERLQKRYEELLPNLPEVPLPLMNDIAPGPQVRLP